MKKIFALFTALTLAASAFAVEIGKPAPDFTGTDINGKTVKLSDYKGKIVVIESYNSDCPYCMNQYKTGAMQELQKDHGGQRRRLADRGFREQEKFQLPHARTGARRNSPTEKITATAWIDDNSGTIGHLYGMETTPQMFVIAKDGTLVYDGAIDNQPDPFHDPRTAKNYVSAAVDEVIAGKPVTVSSTKPYGCSMKYAD